jgi:hypothetical protein
LHLTREQVWSVLAGMLLTATITLGVISAIASYRNRDNRAMDKLYREAARQEPVSTAQSLDAVKKLASYGGSRSTELLIRIATESGGFADEEVKREAISSLVDRRDSSVGIIFANALQPHEDFENRELAAEALQKVPCSLDCIASILHYLERIFAGEVNVEDGLAVPDDVRRSFQSDEHKLYEILYGVLKQHPTETAESLIRVYGLGSNSPSKFAIDLAVRIHLQEACPALLGTDRSYRQSPELFRNAPRQEVQSAINSLNCK